jgi:HAD superfamily hydrolase (TIGR01549 family)
MIKAILFDLDGTLLGNDVYGTFLPKYNKILAEYMTPYMEPKKFLADLQHCVQAMLTNTDPAVSIETLFWHLFEERTGLETAELEPYLMWFYLERFPELAAGTQKRPSAAKVIRTSFDLGLKVVIATNPMFPISAIEQRLAWAGVPVSDYDYALVTSYENMHSTKPNAAYYREILAMIECLPETAVMVGDTWEYDILPARKAGLHTYWITEDTPGEPPDSKLIDGYGSLKAFLALLVNGWLDRVSWD